jgi:hypothetical protein
MRVDDMIYSNAPDDGANDLYSRCAREGVPTTN